jgi:hypothetical protein
MGQYMTRHDRRAPALVDDDRRRARRRWKALQAVSALATVVGVACLSIGWRYVTETWSPADQEGWRALMRYGTGTATVGVLLFICARMAIWWQED